METKQLRLQIPGKKRQNEYVMVLEVPPKLEMLELLETQPYFLESQSETTFESGILGEIPHAVKLQIYRDYSEIYLGLYVKISTNKNYNKSGELVQLAKAKGVFVLFDDDNNEDEDHLDDDNDYAPRVSRREEDKDGTSLVTGEVPIPPKPQKEVKGKNNYGKSPKRTKQSCLRFEEQVPKNFFQFRVGRSEIEFEGTRRYSPDEEFPEGAQLRNCGGFQVIIVREEFNRSLDCNRNYNSNLVKDEQVKEESGEGGDDQGLLQQFKNSRRTFVSCTFTKSRGESGGASSSYPIQDPEGFQFFKAKCPWPSVPSRLHVVLKVSKLIYSTIIHKEKECPPDKSNKGTGFESFLFCPEFSDVQIKLRGNEVIPAHKLVLASTSGYFRAMLGTQMRESLAGIVDLEAEDSMVLKSLLHFMYTGKLQKGDEDNLSDLWTLADKYDVEELVKHIEVLLLQSLSTENALEMLELSLAVARRGELAKKAKQLLMWNKEIITGDRNAFKDIVKKHPDLIFDLLKI